MQFQVLESDDFCQPGPQYTNPWRRYLLSISQPSACRRRAASLGRSRSRLVGPLHGPPGEPITPHTDHYPGVVAELSAPT